MKTLTYCVSFVCEEHLERQSETFETETSEERLERERTFLRRTFREREREPICEERLEKERDGNNGRCVGEI